MGEIIEDRRHYPSAFRCLVVKEYLAGGISYRGLMRKYGIKSNGAIYRWMQQLGYTEPGVKDRYLSSPKPASLPAKKPNKEQPIDALSEDRQRIKALERQLEDEQLRSEMYKRMIEIAERDLNIAIRKKSGTK